MVADDTYGVVHFHEFAQEFHRMGVQSRISPKMYNVSVSCSFFSSNSMNMLNSPWISEITYVDMGIASV